MTMNETGICEKRKISLTATVAAVVVFCMGLFLFFGLRTADGAAYASIALPTVVVQPEGGEVTYGAGVVTLQAQAEHATGALEYVWYRKGGAGDAEEGRGDALEVTSPDKSGDYYCRITATVGDDSAYADTVTVTATVYKAVVNVEIDDKQSVYGEEPLPLTYTRITALAAGDGDDKLGIALSREEGTDSGTYAIKGTFDSDCYAVLFTDGEYEITKRPLYIGVASPVTVYGEAAAALSYEIEDGYALAEGDTAEELNISLAKVPGTDAGRYAITGFYDNDNYEAVFRPATYTIVPAKIDARLTGADAVYSGKPPEIGCELIGVPDGVELKAVITFNKAVKNAGDYLAYVKLNNRNYTLMNGGEFAFKVKKAPLTIGFEDIVIKKDEDVLPTFTYKGFVNGEDETVLEAAPLISVTGEKEGIFETLPRGAEAANYEITYKEGTVQVNSASLAADGVTLTGSFLPGTTLTADGGDNRFYHMGFNGISKFVVYGKRIDAGEVYGNYSAVIHGVQKYFPLFMRAELVDLEGNKRQLADYGYDEDGNFTYTADSSGSILIYYDILTPLAIICAVVLIISIIAVCRKRDAKRYKRARSGHFYARKYAESVTGRETPDV